MKKIFSEPAGSAAEMIRDLVLRMGAAEKAAELCAALIRRQQKKNVFLPLSPEERDTLKAFPGVSSAPDEKGLFILDGDRLYTRRYWKYEQKIRDNIRRLCREEKEELPPDGDPLFSSLHEAQKKAVQMLCRHRFSLLTGGPGTGKTYTIARAVRRQLARDPGCRIALAAPTGKAAARVREAMAGEVQSAGTIPCSTIHSLLGGKPDGVSFHHDRKNPLPLDWLIVDEASMIALPLMAKLLEAIPDHCRLTLAGDAHQLASVEPGRVFGDLCRSEAIPRCELTVSSRFPPGGEIDRISREINSHSPEAPEKVLEILKNAKPPAPVHYVDLSAFSGRSPQQWGDFESCVTSLFGHFWRSVTPEEALARLPECRLLSPVRQGPAGTERMNEFLSFLAGSKAPRPIMITRNDRELQVANGDIGVVMPGSGELCLPGENASIRRIPLELLPDREIAFCSTVHKAQGSEYQDIILLLPPSSSWENAPHIAELLTREIFYTAVTRTKNRIFLYADEKTVCHCCRTSQREDGGSF